MSAAAMAAPAAGGAAALLLRRRPSSTWCWPRSAPRRSRSSRPSARSPVWAWPRPRLWSRLPQGHQGGRLQGRGRGAEEEAGGGRANIARRSESFYCCLKRAVSRLGYSSFSCYASSPSKRQSVARAGRPASRRTGPPAPRPAHHWGSDSTYSREAHQAASTTAVTPSTGGAECGTRPTLRRRRRWCPEGKELGSCPQSEASAPPPSARARGRSTRCLRT